MHNRQGIRIPLLWQALCDYDLWPAYSIGLLSNIAFSPVSAYLTLTLRSLGFDTFQTNLLVIPGAVLTLVQLLFWTWYSEKINSRFLLVLMSDLWGLPLLITLAVLPSDASKWAKYIISVLIIGKPMTYAIVGKSSRIPPHVAYRSNFIVASVSRNAGSVRTRTVGTALFNMFVQASSIIASNVGSPCDFLFGAHTNRLRFIEMTISQTTAAVTGLCSESSH